MAYKEIQEYEIGVLGLLKGGQDNFNTSFCFDKVLLILPQLFNGEKLEHLK